MAIKCTRLINNFHLFMTPLRMHSTNRFHPPNAALAEAMLDVEGTESSGKNCKPKTNNKLKYNKYTIFSYGEWLENYDKPMNRIKRQVKIKEFLDQYN